MDVNSIYRDMDVGSIVSSVKSHITARNVLLAVVPAYLAYWALVYVYRITLHPLAKFPGPKLAAVSFWYEFYYDLWPHKAQYLWKIKELHEEYGPIVRINPIHIHINDPAYLDDIYASGNKHKRERDPWSLHASDNGFLSGSLLQTMDHDTHRMRRGALNPFFSKRAIQDLESVLVDKINTLVRRLAQAHRAGQVVNFTYAIAALSLDMASAYALGADVGNLGRADWGADWLDAFKTVGKVRPLGRQFPWLVNTAMAYFNPDVVAVFSPQMANLARKLIYPLEMMQASAEEHARQAEGLGGEKPSVNTRTIFMDILDSNLPESEKTPERLNAESSSVLGGVETTTRSLAVIMFYLLKDPAVLTKLRDELKTVIPHPDAPVTLAQLEALPYFSGVVSEGLRLAHGVTSRMPRIAPEEDLRYKQWVIPKGTPVMQSWFLHHTNPAIFPEPFNFVPERWVENPQLKPRYLLAFGRGSRSCLGLNLAYAQIYLGLAKILMRFEMELFETYQERDIDVAMDCFIGATREDSPGVRVKIIKDLKDY